MATHIPAFLTDQVIVFGPLTAEYLFTWMAGIPLLANIFYLIALTFCAILLNYLLMEKELTSRQSHVPAALFILLNAFISQSGSFSLVAPAMVFFLFGLGLYFQIDQSGERNEELFLGNFMVGIAGLLIPPILIIGALMAVYATVFRGTSFRIVLLAILALLMPFYFTWTIFLLNEEGSRFYFDLLDKFHWNLEFSDSRLYIPSIVSAVFLLIGWISSASSEEWAILKKRTWYRFLVSISFLSVGISFFTLLTDTVLASATIGLAGLLYPFLMRRRKWLRNFLFSVFILSAILHSLEVSGLIHIPYLSDWL